jgi:hypothetical protein
VCICWSPAAASASSACAAPTGEVGDVQIAVAGFERDAPSFCGVTCVTEVGSNSTPWRRCSAGWRAVSSSARADARRSSVTVTSIPSSAADAATSADQTGADRPDGTSWSALSARACDSVRKVMHARHSTDSNGARA